MKARNIVIILLLLLTLFTSNVFAYDTTFNEDSMDIIEVGIDPNALSIEYDYYKYSNEGYYNIYFEYLKRRSLSYIVLAICITYLICGGLSGIISFVLNLVSGITGA